MKPHSLLPRVDELDGLRGVLATWVVISHILCWTGFAGVVLPAPFGRIWPNFIFAQPAVEVFIILSGFAISFLLQARPQSYGGFMRERFFRIYPTYLVCLGLGLAAISLTPFILEQASWRDSSYFPLVRELSQSERQNLFAHITAHLTLLNGLIPHNVLPNATGTLLAPAWSVSLEWQYYLVAPLIALLVRSRLGLLLLGAIAYFGMRLQAHWFNPHLAFLPAQLPLFLIGIGSYHLFAYLKSHPASRSNRLALPVVALVVVAVLFSWHVVAVLAWGLVLMGVFIRVDGGLAPVTRLMRAALLHPWLQQLGKISYPLYLVHWPVIIFSVALLIRLKPTVSSPQALGVMLLVGLPALLAVAWALHSFVEAPGMKFGKRRGKRSEPSRH